MNNQFFFLCQDWHKKNYAKFTFMRSFSGIGIDFPVAGGMRKYGELLKVSGFKVRYGFPAVSSQVEPPSNGGQWSWHNSVSLCGLVV